MGAASLQVPPAAVVWPSTPTCVCPAQQRHHKQRLEHFKLYHAAGSRIGGEMDFLLQPGTWFVIRWGCGLSSRLVQKASQLSQIFTALCIIRNKEGSCNCQCCFRRGVPLSTPQ